jgi:hypothetical protein
LTYAGSSHIKIIYLLFHSTRAHTHLPRSNTVHLALSMGNLDLLHSSLCRGRHLLSRGKQSCQLTWLTRSDDVTFGQCMKTAIYDFTLCLHTFDEPRASSTTSTKAIAAEHIAAIFDFDVLWRTSSCKACPTHPDKMHCSRRFCQYTNTPLESLFIPLEQCRSRWQHRSQGSPRLGLPPPP